jgi:arylsulfatase A-like enzyme
MEVPELAASVSGDWPPPEQGFATMIRNIDRDAGRVLHTVRELGLDEKTLVIFTSDNGPHQEGGHQMPYFDSNGPLRGMKRDLYEGGIRVPMIARWPGKIPPGSETDHISGFQDVLPTFAQFAGAPVPETDGISMVPTLLGQPDRQQQHPHLYWEFYEQGGKQAVVQGDWKAVRLNVLKNQDAPLALYDLSKDIGEEDDVADQHPERAARMAEIMKREHVELEAGR